MFIDRIELLVKAGDGGAGCVAFTHEKFRPNGGPSGGDGGKGGDVIFRVDTHLGTLLDLHHITRIVAKNGFPGEGGNKTGKNADSIIVRVPAGTVIINAETGIQLTDLTEGDFVVARGGRGGLGNTHFATPRNQAPTYAQPGEPGDELSIILELHLIADIGLVGLPNSGKSTLISRLTKAHPKVGDYPFTTTFPNLGVAQLDNMRRMTIADIPGIIEGASEGKGMGHEFLRHISRTRVLVLLIDILDNPLQTYETLLAELAAYDLAMLHKKRIIALNKIDATSLETIEKWEHEKFGGEQVITISGVSGAHLRELLETLWLTLSTFVPIDIK